MLISPEWLKVSSKHRFTREIKLTESIQIGILFCKNMQDDNLVARIAGFGEMTHILSMDVLSWQQTIICRYLCDLQLQSHSVLLLSFVEKQLVTSIVS